MKQKGALTSATLYFWPDTLAEEGREISDDKKRWDDRTDRMTFEVRKVNTTVRSVWTNSVRNAFRRQAGWAKLQRDKSNSSSMYMYNQDVGKKFMK